MWNKARLETSAKQEVLTIRANCYNTALNSINEYKKSAIP